MDDPKLAEELEEVAQKTDEVEGFQLHEPTEDELDSDDGYHPPDEEESG